MVPVVGFELTTYRLQGDCSTTELNRRKVSHSTGVGVNMCGFTC
jgi:hypothetical protein